MRPPDVRKFCVRDALWQILMQTAMNQVELSVRVYHRVLTLARRIADQVGNEISRRPTRRCPPIPPQVFDNLIGVFRATEGSGEM